jgi:hypothetical protein
MADLRMINPLDAPEWDQQILRLPGSSFFHALNWADVLRKTYNFKPVYLYNCEGNSFVNLLPLMEIDSVFTGKKGVCLPFTDVCEPIAETDHEFQKLFDQAVALGKKRKWKHLEIRGGEKYLSKEKPSQFFFGHILDLLPGQNKIFMGLRSSTRRNIKKAIKNKVEVTISTSMESMKEFYRLNVMTRREHGLPPQPFNFFRNLHDLVIKKDLGFIVTASKDNIIIAANVYFKFGNKVTYKYGASDKNFHHLRANNLVMWEAINWSINHGFSKLCFGRTELQNNGLIQFKTGWGTQTYQIHYYKYDLRKNVFTTNSSKINPLLKKIFTKLPLPVLCILGRISYRHMG